MIEVESFFKCDSIDQGEFKDIDEALVQLDMKGASKVEGYIKDSQVIIVKHVPVYGARIDALEIGRIVDNKQTYVYLPQIEVDGCMCTLTDHSGTSVSGSVERNTMAEALIYAGETLEELKTVEPKKVVEKPYLEETKVIKKYNPKYGDDKICVCGHPYHRHFDFYEDEPETAGCKYCGCNEFKEATAKEG